MSPKNHTPERRPGRERQTFDPSAPSPLHAALQELESLLSGVALPSETARIDPATGRTRTSAHADDERAGTDLSERLLDVAAGLASLHPALHAKRLLVRSLLAWEAKSGAVSASLEDDPRTVLGPDDLAGEAEARLRGKAIGRIWQEKMLDSAAASVALGAEPTDPQPVASLRRRSALLGLRHDRDDLFPAFQFDLSKRRLHPEVEAANRALGAERDPWGVASWWISPNQRLDGDRPMDLVGTDRSRDLMPAASALLEPIGKR